MLVAKRFTVRNEPFVCAHCGLQVQPAAHTCRNHCPSCLYSRHLDVYPGDRAAECGGLMQPVRVEYNSRKGYQIVHHCQRCGIERKNQALLDDPVQPDSLNALLALMRLGG
ncbi:MAG: RNHCP domain-containing protein [Alicyclobacillus sp.]|nr:RNHCP domain-containing protein [Alicyclobacillus sp.]